MSKIKVQSNASGTGVFTVTSPATNTDRTITLPDGTGTLLNSDGDGSSLTNLPAGGVDGITSASSSGTAIAITSANKVGIGTSNADSNLHVIGTGQNVLKITDASNYTMEIGRLGSSGEVGFMTMIGTSAELAFGTNSTERLKIRADGKVGIGTAGGAGQLDINSGTANTIAKFTSGDDNGFIQIEDDDTTGYVDVQNGWISIGGNASSLHANNLSINVSDGRGLSQFTAKAWMNLNQIGTQTIQDSHGVSSSADNGVGKSDLNFAVNMANDDYSTVMCCEYNSLQGIVAQYTGTVACAITNTNHSYEDRSNVNFVVFGD